MYLQLVMVTLIMGWLYILLFMGFVAFCFWDWDRLDRIEDKQDGDHDSDLL
tara:strand:+ start:4413 stop:4565 length:153 start_codon:yes stop_codon:yes gene_type:complete